jgi:hypothetical protein
MGGHAMEERHRAFAHWETALAAARFAAMRRSALVFVPVLLIAFLGLPAAASAYVFWTSPAGSIGRIGNDGGDPLPALIPGGAETAPIAVGGGHLYYRTDEEAEAGGNLIARTDLDGAAGTLLPEGALSFGAVAIGAVDAEHIYWIDGTGIGRARLDGSDPEPEFLLVTGGPEMGGIAVYDGFVYWTDYDGGVGHLIGRANLGTKIVEGAFVELTEESGPRAIAADAEGIYWVWEGNGPAEGEIGHVGLGGGTAVLDAIPGIDAVPLSLAITGSDLYWINFQEGSGISLAHGALGGAASTVDLHFVDHIGPGYLAADSTTGPPPPPPPPPPAAPGPGPTTGTTAASGSGSTAPSASAPPPRLGTPKLRLNHKAGTATLTLAVPEPGTVVLSGAGLRRAHETIKAPGPVTLPVRPTAKTATQLRRTGKAKLAAKLTVTPPSGPSSSRVVSMTLRLDG